MPRCVGIFVFDDVEVLDFAGPFEVFSTASRVKKRMEPNSPAPFKVFLIARNHHEILARGGLRMIPHYTFDDHEALDVLIIPGGIVAEELTRPDVIDWITTASSTTEITASVCTGAFLLAKAGFLDERPATTHWEDIPDLQRMFPKVLVKKQIRWVDDGDIITSAGISAGIDISLHIVARLEVEELAIKTARQMEFDWRP
jgi:transcriptional regulator GlxA family with amidase domain